MPNKQEEELLNQIAEEIHKRQLTAPAILFLDSMKPLSFLGGQFMAFCSPFVHMVVDTKVYDAFAEAIEDRDNVEYLISQLEMQNDDTGKPENGVTGS
jgi:hypothetical protein